MLAQYAFVACIFLQITARSWAQDSTTGKPVTMTTGRYMPMPSTMIYYFPPFLNNVTNAAERTRYNTILSSNTMTKQEIDDALKKWAADNNIAQIYKDYMDAQEQKALEMYNCVKGNLTGMALKEFEEYWTNRMDMSITRVQECERNRASQNRIMRDQWLSRLVPMPTPRFAGGTTPTGCYPPTTPMTPTSPRPGVAPSPVPLPAPQPKPAVLIAPSPVSGSGVPVVQGGPAPPVGVGAVPPSASMVMPVIGSVGMPTGIDGGGAMPPMAMPPPPPPAMSGDAFAMPRMPEPQIGAIGSMPKMMDDGLVAQPPEEAAEAGIQQPPQEVGAVRMRDEGAASEAEAPEAQAEAGADAPKTDNQ